MNLEQIKKIFSNQPYIAVMVYKEKIIYINKTFQEIIGYDEKEVLNFPPEWIFPTEEQRERIREVVKRRLRGEEFPSVYKPFEVINKYNKRVIMKFFTKTIKLDSGDYAGLVIGMDVTDEYKKEFMLNILKDINQTVILEEDEDSIFRKIVKIFDEGKYDSAIILIKDKDDNRLKAKYHSCDDIEFLNFMNECCELKNNNYYCSIMTKLNNNEIYVLNDIEKETLQNSEFLDYLLKKEYKSFVFVPILKHNKPYVAIALFSKYKNDFDENIISILKEAKRDMEFALKKIESISYLKLMQEALDKTYAWILITDEKGVILYVNKTVEEITEYSAKELIGKKISIFISGFHPLSFYKNIWKKLQNNEIVERVIINKTKTGKLFYLKSKFIPVKTSDGTYYITLGIDITNEKNLQNMLKKDILTNLLNRKTFVEKVKQIIRRNRKYACIIIDIKDFKIFNQIHGNKKGDELLKNFAEFLRNVSYKNDVVARIGGDEFALFFEYRAISDIYAVINKIIDKIKSLENFENQISVNMGIALYPENSTDVESLVEKAILASEMAKKEGDFTFEFYTSDISERISKYLEVKNLLNKAIKNNNFVYYFQPYVDAFSFKTVGAETLLRIQLNEEIIYPDMFIDFAENSGLIKKIEKLMLPKYLEYLKKANIPLSFNLSGKSVNDKEYIYELFKDVKNLPVVIELTERELVNNMDTTKEILEFFKIKSFKLSIDDFGTGYSSLTYLKNLPVDYIKIDISFIRNIEESDKDLAVVETIINFAHKFGMKTIAEGVETKSQVEILQNLKCDYLQGYFFAKPMPFEKLMEYIKNKG